MTFLKVDLEVLGKTVQSLRSSEQVLTDAMKAMSKDSHPDIGTKELNDAADSFQTRWKYGIERIGEAAKVTADGVQACYDAYQQQQEALAKAIEQAKNTVDSTGAPQPKATA